MPDQEKPDFGRLRARAEALFNQTGETGQPLSEQDIKSLLHEIQVYQIELEMQNEELRNTQQELQRSRDHFQQLFLQAPVSYVLLDEKGRIQDCNDTFIRLIGRERSAYQKKLLSDFMHPEDSHIFLSRLRALLHHPQGKTQEFRLRDAEGRDIWVRMETALFPGADPEQPQQLMLAVSDIRAEKEHSREVADSAQRMESMISILQNRNAGIQEFLDFALNEAIKITHSLYGYIYHYDSETKQFILNSWSRDVMEECTVVNPQTCYELDKTGIWGEVVRQGRPIMVNDFAAAHPLKKGYPKGHVQLTRFLSVPVRDGDRIVAVVGVANKSEEYDERDVLQLTLLMDAVFNYVDRRRSEQAAEEHLNESKRRISFNEALLSALPTPVFFKDMEGRYLGCNQAFEEVMGVTSQEITGKTVFELWPSELAQEYHRRDLELMEEGQRQVYEFQVRDRHKQLRDVLFAKDVFRDENGQVIGMVGAFMDITDKLRLLDAIQNSQKLESLGILAGGIAHDFNNLLTGIYGFIDLSRNLTAEPAILENLQEALGSLERARNLTRQLLTFARGGEPVMKTVQLGLLLSESVSFALSGSGVHCDLEIGPNLYPAHLDPSQIAQVIDNLVINAKQAMGGAGNLTVGAENCDLGSDNSMGLAEGPYLLIRIRDSGPGIPRELFDKIFDPFYTTKKDGHGLGLATSYSIIKKHAGHIRVQSEAGQGAEFLIYLPASRDQEAVDAAQTVLPASAGMRAGRVLVMDDDATICRLVERILQPEGVEVLSFAEGGAVLEYLAQSGQKTISAIILDLTVPGGRGGLSIIQPLRELLPDVPVYVSSGYADDPVMSDPHSYGFSGAMHKPFVIQDLRQLLNS